MIGPQLDQILPGLAIGIGLSAATGLRAFIPLPGVSIAAATAVEVTAYYIPWLDNALDSVAAPAAVVAGTLLTVALLGDAAPFLRWTLGIIAGGGVAGIVQAGSMLVRGASTAATGGLGNPLVAIIEFIGSALLILPAILIPALCVALAAALVWLAVRKFDGRARRPVPG